MAFLLPIRQTRRLKDPTFSFPLLQISQLRNHSNSKIDNPSPEFLLNCGKVVETLREDLPLVFSKELDYSIYAKNVTFYEDVLSNIRVQGIPHYKKLIKYSCSGIKLYYKDPKLDVLKITQRSPGVIVFRWTFSGTPRKLIPFLQSKKPTVDIYEGVFVYVLNEKGWVCEHILERTIPPLSSFFRNLTSLFHAQLTPSVKFSTKTPPKDTNSLT